MRKTVRHENLMIEFISSGMGSSDYCVTLCGQGVGGNNPSLRLKVGFEDKSAARYCDPKHKEIPPEKIIFIYNKMMEEERADFLVWAEKNDVDPIDYPPQAKLLTAEKY